MVRFRLLSAALALAIAALAHPALADGDAAKGKKVFRKCAVCHKVQPGKHGIGPSLFGVFGRKAATAKGYRYSPAMKKSGLTWNEETLEKYLADPRKVVKGTRMVFPGLRKKSARENAIAYLKTLK